jgi:hypothetical protein
MNPKKVPNGVVLLCLLFLLLFVFVQIISLLFDAKGAVSWFRELVISS